MVAAAAAKDIHFAVSCQRLLQNEEQEIEQGNYHCDQAFVAAYVQAHSSYALASTVFLFCMVDWKVVYSSRKI